ncbi:MAG: SH3 beta-barrel fold-containing protein, partial [Sarcina sp.]
MKFAHKFYNELTYQTFGDALKHAWKHVKAQIHKLNARPIGIENIMYKLYTSVVEFGYYKLNGEYRVFRGTLNKSYIPESNRTDRFKSFRNNTNLRFFDLSVNEWRSLA